MVRFVWASLRAQSLVIVCTQAMCGQDGRRFSEDICACLWVQFAWRSVSIWLLLRWTCISRKGRLWCNEFEYPCVNMIVGWTEFT